MAHILERGITLFHPYSRNKSDYADLFFLLFLKQIGKGNNDEIKFSTAFNNSSYFIHYFELVK